MSSWFTSRRPQHPANQCGYLQHECQDIAVESADSGQYPNQSPNPPGSTPFTYVQSGTYALELNNIDLEDAGGHALSLYPAAVSGTNSVPKKVNDIWIHNSAIDYSAITGILTGVAFANYDSRFCDQYAAHNYYTFDSDPNVFASRNILIQNNTFEYNNTGAIGGGPVRDVGLLNNYFYVNYISPQDKNPAGGAIGFDECADRVEIAGNTIIGPNSATGIPPSGYAPFNLTPGIEAYSRNLNVHNNTISGQSVEGILAGSLFNGTISQNHVLQDNNWYAPIGGINVTTNYPLVPCDPLPRDTSAVLVTANDSNPIDVYNNNNPLAVGPPTQAYGVHLSDHDPMNGRSTDRLLNVEVDSNNFQGGYPLYFTQYQVFLDLLVELQGYSGMPYTIANPQTQNPRRLPVDVTAASSNPSLPPSESPLWPIPPRCPDPSSLPPGAPEGSARAIFKFSASDIQGAGNIAWIQGIFSVGGNDADGSGGPSTATAPDNGICNFAYDAVNNLIYLGDGTGSGWIGPSAIGSGSDLSTQGGCVIHAATSTLWAGTGMPQASPKVYVLDLNLDVTLPTSPANHYHIYSFVENRNYDFDVCGTQSSSCPTWKYSGYWQNTQ